MSAEVLPFHHAPRTMPQRTCAWVLDWHRANDRKLRSEKAKTERARLFKMFADFYTGEGKRLGDAFTGDCIGADLVEFLNKHTDGKEQWTRRRWCNTIKRPFREAAKLGLIAYSPFQAVTEGRGRRGRDISWDEFRALLRNVPPAMRLVMLFVRLSGCRPEEIRTAEIGHANLMAKEIIKWKHKTSETTAQHRPRRIPLSSQLLRLVLYLIRKHPPGQKWLFTNTYGGQWKPRALCKNIANARKKAGLPNDVKLYGCRHAFCTEAVLNGLDVATIAELVGHQSIMTTQNYLHLAGKRDHLAASMEKASKFNGGKAAAALPGGMTREQAVALIEILKGFVG